MEQDLKEIQQMLMKQMKRLDDETLSATKLNNEIARSNTLSTSASSYVKTCNVEFRLNEIKNSNIKKGIFVK